MVTLEVQGLMEKLVLLVQLEILALKDLLEVKGMPEIKDPKDQLVSQVFQDP